MYYSMLTAAAAVLAVLLLLLCRYLGKARRRERDGDAGFTVIPLREGADPRLTERLVRACCWETAFGGGMARRVLLVSCGCEELDKLGERLAGEFEDITIVGAGELAAMMTEGYTTNTGMERFDEPT